MESPLLPNTGYPLVAKNDKRSHISIRSITYKKSLDDKKDYDQRKEMSCTLNKFPNSPDLTAHPNQTSPTRASTQYGSKPETALTKPYMACTFHKLSMGGAKNSPQKPRTNILPQVRASQAYEPQASLMNSSNFSQTTNNNRRYRMGKDPKAGSAQEDYFKLLYDENRKTFSVEECEGVDEYYTDEVIMRRIHNMGFRDSGYYGKRVERTNMVVPDEKTIRDDYKFKMPPVISELENENTLAAHVLGGAQNNFGYVQSVMESAKNEMSNIKMEKVKLEEEIDEIKRRFEKETSNIEADFLRQFEQLTSTIKEDFVASQNDNFKYQKEITLLKRDKLKLENEIGECLPLLENLEDVLYGQGIFNLEPNEANLNNISTMNLRAEVHSTMRNSRFIH